MTGAAISHWKLAQARRCFEAGGIIAYPTEAVYGLGCDPLDPYAVQRLLRLKQRPLEKGLILIAADYSQLRPYISPLDSEVMAPVLASWPGPHTWILPAAPGLPDWLSGGRDSIAVRVTRHPLTAQLCRYAGSPLVSTSANPSGHRPATTPLTVRRYFPQGIDLLLHGPLGGLSRPSQIHDARSGQTLRR